MLYVTHYDPNAKLDRSSLHNFWYSIQLPAMRFILTKKVSEMFGTRHTSSSKRKRRSLSSASRQHGPVCE